MSHFTGKVWLTPSRAGGLAVGFGSVPLLYLVTAVVLEPFSECPPLVVMTIASVLGLGPTWLALRSRSVAGVVGICIATYAFATTLGFAFWDLCSPFARADGTVVAGPLVGLIVGAVCAVLLGPAVYAERSVWHDAPERVFITASAWLAMINMGLLWVFAKAGVSGPLPALLAAPGLLLAMALVITARRRITARQNWLARARADMERGWRLVTPGVATDEHLAAVAPAVARGITPEELLVHRDVTAAAPFRAADHERVVAVVVSAPAFGIGSPAFQRSSAVVLVFAEIALIVWAVSQWCPAL